MVMSPNPPDIPGYTQMYTFGVALRLRTVDINHLEHFVITVRAPSEATAEKHVRSLLYGTWRHADLTFYTDMEIWKQEVGEVS
jgi:hypothetical protein